MCSFDILLIGYQSILNLPIQNTKTISGIACGQKLPALSCVPGYAKPVDFIQSSAT